MRLAVFVHKLLQKQNPWSYHEWNPSSFRSQTMAIKEKLPESNTATVHKILFSDLNVTNTIFLIVQVYKHFTDGHYIIISVVLI
jgi:hypothetical protein